eukprot:4039344-Amphidinium_carterae.2
MPTEARRVAQQSCNVGISVKQRTQLAGCGVGCCVPGPGRLLDGSTAPPTCHIYALVLFDDHSEISVEVMHKPPRKLTCFCARM